MIFLLSAFLPLLGVVADQKQPDYSDVRLYCRDLPVEQYSCDTGLQIMKSLESYSTCEKKNSQPCCSMNRTITTYCSPKKDVWCIGDDQTEIMQWSGVHEAFTKEEPCRYVTGYDYRTALVLSVFLGMFGADRFYLGYYAIGLLKFCTFGFFLLGQLVDIILIATQTVGPADGSDYFIGFYGPILNRVHMENHTFFQYGTHYFKSDSSFRDEM
eukprot:sb/3470091/